MEATKKICFAKREDVVDRKTVNRQFKEFRLSCKNLEDQAPLGWPITVDSGAVL